MFTRIPFYAPVAVALASLALACGGGALPNARTADLDGVRARAAEGGKNGAAALAIAAGDSARDRAKAYRTQGDVTSAGIEDERALASYQRAIALTQASASEASLATAKAEQTRVREQLALITADREKAERAADDDEQKLKVLDGMSAPDKSGKSPAREEARVAAAKAFRAEAQLLCSAAALLGTDTKVGDERLRDAMATASDVDLAMQARATCLSLLTQGRRSATSTTAPSHPDALFSELSATKQWDLFRDERGVIVTLRTPWSGAALTKATSDALGELGRVASAHPAYKIQVAQFGESLSAARKDALESTLKQSKLGSSLVAIGDALPVASRAARNDRIEVVFVHPSM